MDVPCGTVAWRLRSHKNWSLCRRGPWESFTNCMWYAVWVRVRTCSCTDPLCSKIWIEKKVLSLHHTIRELFTQFSLPTAWFRILFRLRRHSVYSIPLTETKEFDLLFTMPWPNLSNKINKISLTELYIDVYWWV